MASSIETTTGPTTPFLLGIQMKKTNQFSFSDSIFQFDHLLHRCSDEHSTSSESTSECMNLTLHNEINDEANRKVELVNDRLDTLAIQERKYKIRDYIGRRANRKTNSNLSHDSDENDYSENTTGCDFENIFYEDGVDNLHQNPIVDCAENGFEESGDPMLNMEIDMSCREKMCEWSYKICDHFQTSREIVAIAFNYLDRFNDVTRCDRTAFKLASMTCLYIATKMFHNKQLSVSTLSDLSRNEFTSHNILQMERVILTTLDYRMNPPTVQAYLQQFQLLFPVQCILSSFDHQIQLYQYDEKQIITCMMNDIFDRATYYNELAVFDYSLISEARYIVAISCLFNAINDVILDGSHDFDYYQQQLCEDVQNELVSMIQTSFSSMSKQLNMSRIYDVQERLWYLYSSSADYQQRHQHQHLYRSEYSSTYGEYINKAPNAYQAKPKSYDRSDKSQESLTSSASPISVLPVRGRISGLSSDQFSVRIF